MGRGVSKAGGAGGGGGEDRSSTIAQQQKTIDKTAFDNMGGGQWQLDIPGIGGGSILDERDSLLAGFGTGPAYSVTVWDKNYNLVGVQSELLYGSLNNAKARLKERLKNSL